MGEPTTCRDRVPELNNHRNHFYHEWIRKEEDCILHSMGIEMRVDAGLRTDKDNPFEQSRPNTGASRTSSRGMREVGVEADMPTREYERQVRARERLERGWGTGQERYRSVSPSGGSRARRTRPKAPKDLLSTRGEGREYWKWANNGTFSLGYAPEKPASLYRTDFRNELQESMVFKRKPDLTKESRPPSRASTVVTDPYSKIGKSPPIMKSYYGMNNC